VEDAMQKTYAGAPMHIGELAAQVGLNPKTIRYYEEIGVLPPPQRTPTGYRRYTADARTRLQFIVQAKAVGLTLGEIRDILTLKHTGQIPCPHVLALVAEKIAAIDVQLRTLGDMRRAFVTLQAVAPGSNAGVCGIIEHAAQDQTGTPT